MSDIRPPIPLTAANRPTTGGLVIPAVNLLLADGGADFRGRHTATLEKCWTLLLCQVCERPLTNPAIIFGEAEALRSGRFDEPPLCTPCADYAARACPMIAGRLRAYADRPQVSQGPRGAACATPGCDCGGWTHTDQGGTRSGQQAGPWYAAWIDPADRVLLHRRITRRCSDGGCTQDHHALIIDSGQLRRHPRKIVQVGTPGADRVWRRLTPGETAELIPAPYTLPGDAHLEDGAC